MNEVLQTYLHRPPPLSSMHLTKYLLGVVCIFVMTFRPKYKPLCKAWVPKECMNTQNDVAEENAVGFTTNMDLLTHKLWSTWDMFVDDAIQFPGIAIRQA
jgi:hypothetical protein